MTAARYAYLDAPGPIGLAHRGGALHPDNLGRENTLAAFATAVRLGYRYVETDVHATADGVLLAFHDDRLDRVSDATGLVADLPYAAVREARVGGTEPVPLLAEVLDAWPDLRVNVDVKASGAIAPLTHVVRAAGAQDRVCVASFSGKRLRAVRALLPGVCTATTPAEVARLRLAPGPVGTWLDRLLRSPAAVLQVPETVVVRGRTITVVTPGLLARAHAAGKRVHVWTVDDRGDIDRLLDLGVDGIVSDRIDVLADALAARGAPLVPPAPPAGSR